jgi:23S rRNA pseudouridine1911/1915/1917 synthase
MEMRSQISTNKPFSSTVSLVVEESQAGQRIDKFLSVALPEYSRSFFQGLLEQKAITINALPAKSSAQVKTADTIKISFPLEPNKPLFNPVNTDLGIKIVYTHEHFFIIAKPAKLLVHQTETITTEPTVVDWLLTNHHELVDIGSIERPGIVHRLDRETSGLLIIPRTNFAHQTFGAMFKQRTIAKTYLAIVEGHPPAAGSIDFSIGRHPGNRKKMMAHVPDQKALTTHYRQRNQPATRHALSHYTVLRYFDNHALVQVNPLTGRTHQIRVHLSAIGHPLVGDFIYGTPSKLIDRHALHASSLSFTFQNVPYTFSQEIPNDFKRLLEILEQ